MAQLLSTLAAVLALTGPVSATPLILDPEGRCNKRIEYADGVRHEGPFVTAPESAGGMSCISSSDAEGSQGCSHSKTYSHSVGVTHTVGGGLTAMVEIKEIFTLGGDISASQS